MAHKEKITLLTNKTIYPYFINIKQPKENQREIKQK